MKVVGIVGQRGMVGSVLFERMKEEGDFNFFTPCFFSTSLKGKRGPQIDNTVFTYEDAYDLYKLKKMDIIISTQGGDYTSQVYDKLHSTGWKGYWIDAASTLRGAENTMLLLDPINLDRIHQGLANGCKTFVGANCTVSLLLMATAGLFKHDMIEWISTMTYQAASGAGARGMEELLQGISVAGRQINNANTISKQALECEKNVVDFYQEKKANSTEVFTSPLALGLIPWIDSTMPSGQTREEWKGQVEANNILGNHKDAHVPIDGTCVRVGTLRCHSQGLTMKLRKKYPLDEINEIISLAHQWVKLVPNEQSLSSINLNPLSTSGTLNIPVGRVRKMSLGDDFLNIFTVGDQLLWGAAEPLRRFLQLLVR